MTSQSFFSKYWLSVHRFLKSDSRESSIPKPLNQIDFQFNSSCDQSIMNRFKQVVWNSRKSIEGPGLKFNQYLYAL